MNGPRIGGENHNRAKTVRRSHASETIVTPRPLLVLAGGFGTRLQPVLPDIPKPLAPVGSRPFLQLLLEKWVEQGVQQFLFLLHHQAKAIERFLTSQEGRDRLRGCMFDVVIETRPMGTGGAVALAVQHFQLSSPFLVANADTWMSTGITDVTNAEPPAMAIVKVANASRYGRVEVEQNRIVGFEEKSPRPGANWINAGLYHLTPDVFTGWDGAPMSLERDVLPELVRSNRLRAVPLQADFFDIGVPEEYARFRRWIESSKGAVL